MRMAMQTLVLPGPNSPTPYSRRSTPAAQRTLCHPSTCSMVRTRTLVNASSDVYLHSCLPHRLAGRLPRTQDGAPQHAMPTRPSMQCLPAHMHTPRSVGIPMQCSASWAWVSNTQPICLPIASIPSQPFHTFHCTCIAAGCRALLCSRQPTRQVTHPPEPRPHAFPV